MRKSYERSVLDESSVAKNPFSQFELWLEQAISSEEIYEANAMTLASTGSNGSPSARIVLLKKINEEGLVFYTNYESRKGQELISNPKAAALFHWDRLQRQVRIEGEVMKLDEEESTAYFHSRPKGSQMGAWASPQSKVIEDRSILEENLEEIKTKYIGVEKLPRPENWGGFIIRPHYWEFWQGRPSRLHDRICYRLENKEWKLFRIAP